MPLGNDDDDEEEASEVDGQLALNGLDRGAAATVRHSDRHAESDPASVAALLPVDIAGQAAASPERPFDHLASECLEPWAQLGSVFE